MQQFTAERLRMPFSSPQAVPTTSAVLWRPSADAGRHGLVLAHGAGTDMTNPVLTAVARGVAARGYPALAFNFGYTEAGRKRPDPAKRLEAAYLDAVDTALEVMGERPLVGGGRSMGGRMASHVAASTTRLAGLVLLGYPLHPRIALAAGQRPPADSLRTGHWPAITVPLLFVQGDRDALCDLDVLEAQRRRQLTAASSDLHVVGGGDHGFSVRKSDDRSQADVLDEVAGVVADWLDDLDTPADAHAAAAGGDG